MHSSMEVGRCNALHEWDTTGVLPDSCDFNDRGDDPHHDPHHGGMGTITW